MAAAPHSEAAAISERGVETAPSIGKRTGAEGLRERAVRVGLRKADGQEGDGLRTGLAEVSDTL